MSITSWYLIGLVPAGLIVLVGMLIVHASANEVKARNLVLYFLGVGVLSLLAIAIAAQLTPEGDSRPLAQVANLLAPSLLGVLALILVHLGALVKLRGRILLVAGLLALIMVALIVPLWQHPYGVLFYLLPGAFILGVTWPAARRAGNLVIVLSLVSLAFLAVYGLYSAASRQDLPAWLGMPAGLLFFALPGISVTLAAIMILSGLNKLTGDENQAEEESAPGSRPRAYLQFALAGLLLGALAYRIYWFSIWDQTKDGLSGIFFMMPASLVGIGAGMVMTLKSAGRMRLLGAAFAVLAPVVMMRAFQAGWAVDYHAITEGRAARIQGALERFHGRNGRYPAELSEMVPRDLLFVPQPVIFQGEGWCYQGRADGYRLGAVYREYFGLPLSIKIYASDGDMPDEDWKCPQKLAELQAVYEPAPFYEQEIQVPAETPLPTSQVPGEGMPLEPIVQGAFVRWGEWSPDGGYLPISQVVAAEGVHYVEVSFMTIERGEVCRSEHRFEVQDTPWGPELRQHFAWSPAGVFLYLTPAGDIVELRPCEPGAARRVAAEQGPFELIAAYHAGSGRALLQTSEAYWVMDTASMAMRQIEAVRPNPNELRWDNFAWSPTGERLAISQMNARDESEGSTLYVLSGESGQVERSLPLESASAQSAPWVEWVNSHEVLISGNEDIMILDLDQPTAEFTYVIKDIFNLDLAHPDEIAAWDVVIDEEGENYHLALRANHPRNQDLYLYHSENGQVEVLHPEVHGYLIFPDGQAVEMPRFSFEREYPDAYEVFWVDQPGKAPSTITPQGHSPRSYPRLGVHYLAGREQLAFSSSQGVSLVSLPEGELLDFWRLAGEGHVNVLAAKNGEALVAARERVDEADLFYIPLLR